MRPTEDYLSRAEDMARLARRAATPTERQVYHELSAAYARLAADSAEFRPATDQPLTQRSAP